MPVRRPDPALATASRAHAARSEENRGRRQASDRDRSGREVMVDEQRARELVARERARIETALTGLRTEIRDEGALGRQQTGEQEDAGSDLQTESVSMALQADLRAQLAAVGRAEERLALGTYGRSVESGRPIPDERLEAEPLAERTIEEQRHEDGRGPMRAGS